MQIWMATLTRSRKSRPSNSTLRTSTSTALTWSLPPPICSSAEPVADRVAATAPIAERKKTETRPPDCLQISSCTIPSSAASASSAQTANRALPPLPSLRPKHLRPRPVLHSRPYQLRQVHRPCPFNPGCSRMNSTIRAKSSGSSGYPVPWAPSRAISHR